MITIFQASTFFQVLCLAAMLRDRPKGADDRWILLTTNASPAPEVTPGISETPGFAALRGVFDDVIDFNEQVAPQHPRGFRVDENQAVLYAAAFRQMWGLGNAPLHLSLAWSPTMPPGLSLARIFKDAELSLHFDGLMSFGPLPGSLPTEALSRMRAVHYIDIAPGVTPTLLPDLHLDSVAYPADSLRGVIEDVASTLADSLEGAVPSGDYAFLIGQYLGNLGIVTVDEELRMHKQMLDRAAERGITRAAFKPHPNTHSTLSESLVTHAAKRGIELTVVQTIAPVELLFAIKPPRLVLSCFSTALATADACFNIEVEAVWSDILLEKLTPYQNSNRVPLSIVDVLYRPGSSLSPEHLPDLVVAIAYNMRPTIEHLLRDRTARFLTEHFGEAARYFKRRRLTRLDLPGRLPAKARPSQSAIPATLRRGRRAGLRIAKRTLARYPKLHSRVRETVRARRAAGAGE